MDKTYHITHYKIFEQFENLVAFTTTKKTFNIKNPRFTGDFPELFINSRKSLAAKLKIGVDQIIFPRQEHTNCIAELNQIPDNELIATDALITKHTEICSCIQTADCVPILLFDPENRVVAAVHAGWRGTVKKIAEITVSQMISDYHSQPKKILAVIGPSIGPAVYEVGNEVVDAVRNSLPEFGKTLHLNNSGKYHFNLWKANKQLLVANGIQPQNIEIAGECSFTLADKYFSARREGVNTGRMVSGMMLL